MDLMYSNVKIYKKCNSSKSTNNHKNLFLLDLVIEPNTIFILKSKKNYTIIVFKGGYSKISAYTLMRFEELLIDEGRFVRINRSTIVNINFIKAFDIVENILHTISGEILVVSRRRLKNVTRFLEDNSVLQIK